MRKPLGCVVIVTWSHREECVHSQRCVYATDVHRQESITKQRVSDEKRVRYEGGRHLTTPRIDHAPDTRHYFDVGENNANCDTSQLLIRYFTTRLYDAATNAT